MNPTAMEPFGRALLACAHGQSPCDVIIRRDDGLESVLPAGYFFRRPCAFSRIEHTALARCRGSVLDVGAGTGVHTLWLQTAGFAVTALDISADAVAVMQERGVRNTRLGDVLELEPGAFDTLLLLGHGIGMVEDLAGLDRFLGRAPHLTTEQGQVLVHSLDVRLTDDARHLAYHEANMRAGRYFGETRVRFEFTGSTGPYCGWLHVDAGTLADHARRSGWACEVLLTEESGDYLAVLGRLK